jgi:hypothetical protein
VAHDLSTRAGCNAVRMFDRIGQGHYESFFVRGNHPSAPLAFWIRYTLLVPAGRPDAAVAELWAIMFDGERDQIVAVKETHPLASAVLGRDRFSLRIGAASFEHGSLRGSARTDKHRIAWALDYDASEPPLLLLPDKLYEGGFPKAKSLVSAPLARFRGALDVDGRVYELDGWPGSQNHNWGARHTDRYAWGQVAGFDDEPRAFLECATAQLKIGPFWTPAMTLVVLRIGERTIRLNELTTAVRAKAERTGFTWTFESATRQARVIAKLSAGPERFVALRYDDPEGRSKICLNSKLASCELRVQLAGEPERTLRSAHGAAFEILGEDAAGLDIAV